MTLFNNIVLFRSKPIIKMEMDSNGASTVCHKIQSVTFYWHNNQIIEDDTDGLNQIYKSSMDFVRPGLMRSRMLHRKVHQHTKYEWSSTCGYWITGIDAYYLSSRVIQVMLHFVKNFPPSYHSLPTREELEMLTGTSNCSKGTITHITNTCTLAMMKHSTHLQIITE